MKEKPSPLSRFQQPFGDEADFLRVIWPPANRNCSTFSPAGACLAWRKHQVLLDLKRRGVTIEAIAVRDREADVADFLVRNGDPFDRIGSDRDSRVQMALGSSGVPESFVIDGQGVIRYQHVGPIEPEDVATILAEMEKAR